MNLRAARSEDGGLSLSFGDSRWASVRASGSLRLASGATLPQGTVRFSAERLADLDLLVAPWVGSASGPGLAGRLSADLTLTDTGMALIEAEGQGLRLPGPVEIGTPCTLLVLAERRVCHGLGPCGGTVDYTGRHQGPHGTGPASGTHVLPVVESGARGLTEDRQRMPSGSPRQSGEPSGGTGGWSLAKYDPSPCTLLVLAEKRVWHGLSPCGGTGDGTGHHRGPQGTGPASGTQRLAGSRSGARGIHRRSTAWAVGQTASAG